MEKLKFLLVSIVTLSLLGLLGYWSITTIQSGTENSTEQKVKQLAKENADLKTKVNNLTNQLSSLQSKTSETTQPTTPSTNTNQPPKPTVYKYQNSIDDLQKLINNKVVLKLKSTGAQVGTVQVFLNVYNNTSNKIDNDYGASTVSLVKAFQKDSGLTINGTADSATFSKMIEWLKKQG